MPDTGSYLLLGLAVITLIMGGFVVSLIVRARSLNHDIQTLNQIAQDDHGI